MTARLTQARLLLAIAAFTLLNAAPSAAQTIPDAAGEEAIGRDFAERYEPGRFLGASGAPWRTIRNASGQVVTWGEFEMRNSGAVKLRAARIAAAPPAADACIYRIMGAHGYFAEQARIYASCAGGGASAPDPVRSVTVQFGSGRTQVVE